VPQQLHLGKVVRQVSLRSGSGFVVVVRLFTLFHLGVHSLNRMRDGDT
jgi:hypothetical protein